MFHFLDRLKAPKNLWLFNLFKKSGKKWECWLEIFNTKRILCINYSMYQSSVKQFRAKVHQANGS